MLVGLFRSNPDAFVGKKINRAKAGGFQRSLIRLRSNLSLKERHGGLPVLMRVTGAYRSEIGCRDSQGAAKEEGDATQAVRTDHSACLREGCATGQE